ncbi:hypothetical protein [Ramlibacter sp. WS9]|uniref:hypothetical protein n=1 Tax=Ramlibacter sp. WS9 TaxID=1882741 RepID=UPI00116D9D16|nr:hypothetical protein [Ramlibacter sp. WS9]ROZ78137.1 hypothetical protein EEB15_06730 [Ramlibacter sp. WS9]
MTVWLQPVDERHSLESPWMRVNKFAYLNGLGGQELAKALRHPEHVTREERKLIGLIGGDMAWLRGRPHADVVHGLRSGAPFGDGYDHIVLRDAVRYCPHCLGQGFHSLIFQAAGIVRCPFHHVPLASSCPACGSSMPSMDSVRRTDFVPLHCSTCRRPFCDLSDFDLMFKAVPSLAPILACFRELTSRLEECFRLDLLQVSIETSPVQKRSRASMLSILWALQFSTDLPDYLEPFPALCWGPTVRDVRVADRLDRWRDTYRGPARLLRVAAADSRSLDTAISRTLRSIGGHEARHSPTIGYVLWDEGEKFVLIVRPSTCTCCETLVHWRATKQGLLTAIDKLPRLGAGFICSLSAGLRAAQRDLDMVAFGRTAVQRAIRLLWRTTEADELLVGYQRMDISELMRSIDSATIGLLGSAHEMLRAESLHGMFTVRLDGMVIDRALRATAESMPAKLAEGTHVAIGRRSAWFFETGSIASRRSGVDPWVMGLEVTEKPARERAERARATVIEPKILQAPATHWDALLNKA